MKNSLLPLLLLFISNWIYAQEKELSSYIQSYAQKHNFNGTVLVQKETKTIYHKSFGLAERKYMLPINNATLYKIASITKAFTAVLILQLKDDGKLKLNQTIDQFLPNYKGRSWLKSHHTSIIKSYIWNASNRHHFKLKQCL